MARITLNGFYQYDKTLFDNVRWSETSLEKDVMISAIMSTSGELFPVHQSFEHLKINITDWFNRNAKQFSRLILAIESEYNPIENYDRYEDSTRTPNLLSERETSAESSSESTVGTSAYNVNDYANRDKSTASSDGSSSESVKQTGNERNVSHIHGNIGVMASSTLAEMEFTLREKYGDVYKRIAMLFEREFLSQVY